MAGKHGADVNGQAMNKPETYKGLRKHGTGFARKALHMPGVYEATKAHGAGCGGKAPNSCVFKSQLWWEGTRLTRTQGLLLLLLRLPRSSAPPLHQWCLPGFTPTSWQCWKCLWRRAWHLHLRGWNQRCRPLWAVPSFCRGRACWTQRWSWQWQQGTTRGNPARCAGVLEPCSG